MFSHLYFISWFRLSLLGLCNNPSTNGVQSYTNSSGNLIIEDCSFSRSALYSGKGAVICCDHASTNMTLIRCMFYNCKVSGNSAGAIWFYAYSNGISTLSKVCGSYCSASSNQYHHFGYFHTGSGQPNIMDFVSICNCPDSSVGEYSFDCNNGNQRLTNVNSSKNKVVSMSGYSARSPQTLTISYSTFFSNHATSHSCLEITDSPSRVLSYSNMISNTNPSRSLIYVTGSNAFSIVSCIFSSNTNCLIESSASTVTMNNSTIQHSGTISIGSFTNKSNLFTTTPTYVIIHFNSYHCFAENLDVPSTPSLTPYVGSLPRTYDDNWEYKCSIGLSSYFSIAMIFYLSHVIIE